ncbi:MAG: protein-export chaperone SecB [Hyphomicrobiales bacterium]
MSDTDSGENGASGPTNGAAAEDQPAPEIRMLAQYIKDASFENPRVPDHLPASHTSPEISINVNVNARPLDEDKNDFEIELGLEAKGEQDGQTIFLVELVYGARIVVKNVPDDMKPPLTLIEGPRMIFPFARRILADLVRDGGFPPLMIEPIDFAALYRHRIEQMQASENAGADSDTASS